MKMLLAILVLLLFVCAPGYSFLISVSNTSSIFQVVLFVNGTPGDVCANGVTDQIAGLLCSNDNVSYIAGTNVSGLYDASPMFDASYTNVRCPDGPQSCNDSSVEVDDNNCSSHGGLLLVECTDAVYIAPDCFVDGKIKLESTVINGSSTSGYLTVCNNGKFIPICESAQSGFTELEFRTICTPLGLSNGYTPGITLPPLTNISDTVVATNYSCSSYNCSATTVKGPCYQMRYATVTCFNDTDQERPSGNCGQSGVSLLNSTRIVSGGQETVTGIPLLCAGDGGPYNVPCNESTRAQEVSSLLCDFLGFETGSLLPPNPALYGIVPQGMFYVTNFSCPSNVTADEIVDCDATQVLDDSQCEDGSLVVVVQCSRAYTPTSTVASTTPSSTVVSSTASIRVTPTMDTNGTSSSSNIGPIVGGVIGGVLVVAIIVVVVVIVVVLLVVVKKKKSVSPLETGTGGKKEAVELSKYKDVKA